MAIDTKSLTQLITEFRALKAKDSITPESLGYILQRIADLLATAGTSDTMTAIQNLLNGFKAAGQAVVSLQQGAADRNHILANIRTVNLGTGAVASSSGHVFIQQATTERAGAMRAQQVVDLNNTRRGLADAEKLLKHIEDKLGLNGTKGLYNAAQIAVVAEDGYLRLLGGQQLVADGYVPYLFRLTRKRNQWDDRAVIEGGGEPKKYCSARKGWNLFGSVHTIRLSGTFVEFSTNPHTHFSQPCDVYSRSPSALMRVHNNSKGIPCVAWGRSVVALQDLNNRKNPKKHRLLRFRFAIGFAKKSLPGRALLTTANLVSSLVEFSVVYDPVRQQFKFGK